MHRLAQFALGLVATAAATLAAIGVVAAPNTLQLPPETARLRPSTQPSTQVGFMIATQKCAICHSVDYIDYQPPGMNQAQWTAEVAKMQHAYGAPLGDDEVRQVGAYLAVAYGTAQAGDAAVIAAGSAVAANAPGSAPAVGSGAAAVAQAASATVEPSPELKALLTTNACLSCHAINQTIVGPAYHDVAQRYKDDAGAQAKLEASIRNGSVGRWGQAPMPPYAALTDAQVKALAGFVLAQ